jgi:TFIIF, beta subunit HTH domain/TFIIF, beta subunit N-terminus
MNQDEEDYDESERQDDDDGNDNHDDDDDDEEEDEEEEDDDGDDDDENHNRVVTQQGKQQQQKQQQPVEKERLTVHSYGAVDATHVEDECWLIRIPESVYNAWDKTPEGTELGDIVFTKGGTLADGTVCKPSISVQLDETLMKKQMMTSLEARKKKKISNVANSRAVMTDQMIPLHYTLESMTKKVPVLHPFTRDSSSGRIAIFGTVSRTANLQVQRSDQRYRTMLKNRLVSSMNVSKFVKPVEVTDSILRKQTQRNTVNHTNPNRNTFGDAVFQYGKRKLEALQEANSASSLFHTTNKKLKGGINQPQFESNQPIRSVLFELFQQQSFWTIKDLKTAAITGGVNVANHKKMENEIREILRDEIGIYHRSGDNKNKWELRSEFQQYGAHLGTTKLE